MSRAPKGGTPVVLSDLARSAAQADTTPAQRANPHGFHFSRDEYMRDMLRGLKPGQKFCVPTPWGYYALELDAAGALTVYMATDRGPTRRVFIAPECSNVVVVIPAEA